MSDNFWLKILDLIQQRGRNAIFVLDGRNNCSLETCLINRKIKVWKESINDLHSKFQNYGVFIGVDSMCGHLAAYAGVTNVVTIYKNETHEYFEPLAANAISIYGSKIIAKNGIVRRGHFRADADILVEVDSALQRIGVG
jgi:ADP-heptose:LPS heptosyltransferase